MHRQIGGEARRVCMHVYVRCVCVCVCVQHWGGREGTAGQQRQREKDGRSRQACHRFQRDAPSTRPTDWWRPCSKASWRERESSLRPLSPAWPALPTDGTLRWIGWTEERNTEKTRKKMTDADERPLPMESFVFCLQNAWLLPSDGYHGYNCNKFCFPALSLQPDEDQRYFHLWTH